MIKRVLLVTLLTYLGGIFFETRDHQSSGIKCPKCIHFSVQVKNIPQKYKNAVDAFISGFKHLHNPDCQNGDIGQETCMQKNSHNRRVVKCQTTKVTLIADGIIQFLPESEIIFHLLMKECTSAGADVADGCVSLSDVNTRDRAKIAEQLRGLSTNSLNNATISGEQCTTSQ